MGRKKKSVVSYLCGVFFRKRPPAVEDDDDSGEEHPDPSTASSGGVRGDGTMTPEDAGAKPCSPEQTPSLPIPPGNGHMRTASCGYNLHHRRSSSGVSRLVSSMSLRVMGGGGGAAAEKPSPRIRERARIFKHEDSVWKKTIILGERCRVPDDDDDDDLKLFDEKGNKIITYHPKSHSGLLQYSRQSTSLDADHDFRTNL
ncbi:hypothetical protein AAHA92_32571 [Salvia divinorum]|uniref:Uncharacterized protein n=1 Tax=Salvia divinorum TaxID=28513 RepID=A0ABD1FNB9_SALDI